VSPSHGICYHDRGQDNDLEAPVSIQALWQSDLSSRHHPFTMRAGVVQRPPLASTGEAQLRLGRPREHRFAILPPRAVNRHPVGRTAGVERPPDHSNWRPSDALLVRPPHAPSFPTKGRLTPPAACTAYKLAGLFHVRSYRLCLTVPVIDSRVKTVMGVLMAHGARA
jgi:hypothetical protein